MIATRTPAARSLIRAFSILELLAGSRRALSISEIGRKLSIPKSTAHVLIVTLQRYGYLVADPETGRHRLGPQAGDLGVHGRNVAALAELVLPRLRQLVEETALEACLALLDGRQAIYVQKVEPPHCGRFGIYIGKRTNLHCTAVGKVLLAFSRPAFLLGFLQEDVFSKHTEYTLASSAALAGQIQKIRKAGYALEDEEWSLGVRCLAVPILQSGADATNLALGVMGTTGQIPLESVRPLARILKTVAADLSRQLASAT